LVRGQPGAVPEALLGSAGVAESREADCGRVEGGRFGPKNDCAAEEGGTASSRVVKASKSAAGFGAGTDPTALLRHVGKPRQYEIVGAVANNLGDDADANAEATVGFVVKSGYNDAAAAKVAEYTFLHSDSAAGKAKISAAVGSLMAAKKACPEAKFEVSHDGDVANELKTNQIHLVPAYYSILRGKTVFNLDGALAGVASTADSPNWFSTKSMAHPVAHEDGHRIHFEAIRKSIGIPKDLEIADGSPEMAKLAGKMAELHVIAVQEFGSDPEFRKDVSELSGYALSSGKEREVVAEYYARVRLGGKRTPSLDRFMKRMGFPTASLSKKRGKKK